MTNQIRRLEPRDHDALVEIYREAVLTSTAPLYTAPQQSAWARQCNAIRPMLQRGQGLVCSDGSGRLLAFCLRDPEDRIALLYGHPAAQRQGYGRALLLASQAEAAATGQRHLRTEASLISRPLFEALGWRISWREELLIGGVHFERFRMHTSLQR
jgi:GNAT superfamily N-acetyltransferase